MTYWAYILRCAENEFHVGLTGDLDLQIEEHRASLIENHPTAPRPAQLVWLHEFAMRERAEHMETKIKGWSRAKQQALIADDYDLLDRLP